MKKKYTWQELMQLKRKYPELTFSAFNMLKLRNLSDFQICKMYDINIQTLEHFRKNHQSVLGKVNS